MRRGSLFLIAVTTLIVFNSKATPPSYATGPETISPTMAMDISLDTASPGAIKITEPAKPNFDDVINRLKIAQAEQAAKDQAAAEQAAQDAVQVRMNNYYPDTYAWGNCTAFVAASRGVPNWWGNANQWAYNAASEGWNVTSQPIVGAIAQTTAGWAGHVALVTGVGGGTVTVAEMNVMGLGVEDTQSYPTDYFTYLY